MHSNGTLPLDAAAAATAAARCAHSLNLSNLTFYGKQIQQNGFKERQEALITFLH